MLVFVQAVSEDMFSTKMTVLLFLNSLTSLFTTLSVVRKNLPSLKLTEDFD